jgi:anti-sigma factor RsiW
METHAPARLSPWTRRCLHRYAMPEGARREIVAALALEAHPPLMQRARAWRPPWHGIAAGFAAGTMVGVIAIGMQARAPMSAAMDQEVISSHVRSLMADHLSDVSTADGEAVRSWFSDKLDYAPRVDDLSPQGYALVGGRLDYVAGRAVAAVVYSRAKHVVNLFACPLAGRPGERRTVSGRGFSAVGWTDKSMQYWAVADVDMDELERLAAQLQRTSAR